MSKPIRSRESCPLCGGPWSPWLAVPGDWRRPGDPAAYRLCWCRSCRFGQVRPRPGEAEVAGFYEVDSYYTHGGGAVGAAGRPRTTAERLLTRAAWANDRGVDLADSPLWRSLPPGSRVCDLGCGNGDTLAAAARLGHEAVGVEPDPAARGVALARGLEVHAGTAERLPDAVRAGGYDCVIMSHSLEHCLDPVAAVAGAAGILSGTGVLVAETPNNDAFGLRAAGAAWPWLDVPRHLNFFTGRSLRAVCGLAGLRVRSAEYTGYTRQFSRQWAGAERAIRENFAARGGRRGRPTNPWALLIVTAPAPRRFKYDSVRVTAGR